MGTPANKLFRGFMLLLCVAAQTALLVPHHHHGQADPVCFNVVHCMEDDHREHDGCAHRGHDHDAPFRERDCSITRITVASPRTAQEEIAARFLLQPLPSPSHLTPATYTECSLHREATLSLLRVKTVPDPEPLYTAIVSRTLPARAPSV